MEGEEEEEEESDEGEPEAKKQREEEEEDGELLGTRDTGTVGEKLMGVLLVSVADAMEEETDSEEEAPAATKSAAFGPPQPTAGDVPNPVLFASGLPQEVTSDMLSPLFQQQVPLPPSPQPFPFSMPRQRHPRTLPLPRQQH